MQIVVKARYAYLNMKKLCILSDAFMIIWAQYGKLQVDPVGMSTQATTASDIRFAQHEAEEDAMVRSPGTYDYLLKVGPDVSARVLSIVEVKQKYSRFLNSIHFLSEFLFFESHNCDLWMFGAGSAFAC